MIDRFFSSNLKKINWVLVGVSHPGNLGATLRALKNMGCNAPILVDPERKGIKNCEETKVRASHAVDMIEKIKECSIENAISQSYKVIGFTSRQRNIQPPRVCFDKMIVDIINLIVASSKFEVSFVFGGEKSGLSNNDIKKCTNVCSLDVDCSYPSLNLSHAIQVVSYMFRRQLKIKYDYLNKQNYFLPESNLLETQNKTKLTNQKRVINIEKKILSLSDKVNFRTPTKQGEIAARIHKILVSNEISDKDAKLLESFFALIEKKLNL